MATRAQRTHKKTAIHSTYYISEGNRKWNGMKEEEAERKKRKERKTWLLTLITFTSDSKLQEILYIIYMIFLLLLLLFFSLDDDFYLIYETLISFGVSLVALLCFAHLVTVHGIGPYLVISPLHFDREFGKFSMCPHHGSPLPMKSLCLNFLTHSFLSGWLIDAVTHVTSIALDRIWNWQTQTHTQRSRKK